MKQEAKEILEFFDGYPAKIRDVALGLRTMIHSAMPDAGEMLDRSARIFGYGFGPRYADMICVIIPSKKGVKLGIVRATELPDPKGLLEGSGKVHRHIAFAENSDLRRAGLKALLAAAITAWRKRSDGKSKKVAHRGEQFSKKEG
jgi:hypothetical protein